MVSHFEFRMCLSVICISSEKCFFESFAQFLIELSLLLCCENFYILWMLTPYQIYEPEFCFFFVFCLFRTVPVAYGGSQARGRI